MNLQLNQIKQTALKQGFSRVKIILDSNFIFIYFSFKAEFESNDIDGAHLVTQKNELRNFKTIDAAYKLINSLLDPEKDLFVDVIISDNTHYDDV